VDTNRTSFTPRQQWWVLKVLIVTGVTMTLLGVAGLLFLGDEGLGKGDVLSVIQVIWGSVMVVLGVRGLRRTPMG